MKCRITATPGKHPNNGLLGRLITDGGSYGIGEMAAGPPRRTHDDCLDVFQQAPFSGAPDYGRQFRRLFIIYSKKSID